MDSQPEEENAMRKELENKGEVSRRVFLRDAGLVLGAPAIGSKVFFAPDSAAAEPMPPAAVELDLLNPKGVIDPPPMLGISPRVAALDGKKIAMIHNNKPGAKTFLDALEELLKAKYPSATFTHFDTNINLADKPEKYAAMANSCDAFILGSGD
jgi:hypothetical protein